MIKLGFITTNNYCNIGSIAEELEKGDIIIIARHFPNLTNVKEKVQDDEIEMININGRLGISREPSFGTKNKLFHGMDM